MDADSFSGSDDSFDPVVRRGKRPRSTAELLRIMKQNGRKPKSCCEIASVIIYAAAVGLAVPELVQLRWWEDVSNLSYILSWGPWALAFFVLVLYSVGVCCHSEFCGKIASCFATLLIPGQVVQLAVVSTPAALDFCCCFPKYCVLGQNDHDTIGMHSNRPAILSNTTCAGIVPVSRKDYSCASSRWTFVSFWLASALTLIFATVLVTQHCKRRHVVRLAPSSESGQAQQNLPSGNGPISNELNAYTSDSSMSSNEDIRTNIRKSKKKAKKKKKKGKKGSNKKSGKKRKKSKSISPSQSSNSSTSEDSRDEYSSDEMSNSKDNIMEAREMMRQLGSAREYDMPPPAPSTQMLPSQSVAPPLPPSSSGFRVPPHPSARQKIRAQILGGAGASSSQQSASQFLSPREAAATNFLS